MGGDNVRRAYGEVNVSLCSPCTMQEKTLVRHIYKLSSDVGHTFSCF